MGMASRFSTTDLIVEIKLQIHNFKRSFGEYELQKYMFLFLKKRNQFAFPLI